MKDRILVAVDDHLYDETCDAQGDKNLNQVFEEIAKEHEMRFMGFTSKEETLAFFDTNAEAEKVACIYLDVKLDKEGELAGSDLGRELSKRNEIPLIFLTSKGMGEAKIGYVENRFYYQSKDNLYEERKKLTKITKALINDLYNDQWHLTYRNRENEFTLKSSFHGEKIKFIGTKDFSKYCEMDKYIIWHEMLIKLIGPFFRSVLNKEDEWQFSGHYNLDNITDFIRENETEIVNHPDYDDDTDILAINDVFLMAKGAKGDFSFYYGPDEIRFDISLQPGRNKPPINFIYDSKEEIAKFKDYFTNQFPSKIDHQTWGIFDRDFRLCVGKVSVVLPLQSKTESEAEKLPQKKKAGLEARLAALEKASASMQNDIVEIKKILLQIAKK